MIELDNNPFHQFKLWLEEALTIEPYDASAAALATADKSGRPSCRLVLLKEFDERGFVFFTNYDSRKSADLLANPYAALTFFWPARMHQVRIEGKVEKTSREESETYYSTRPEGSRYGAWASPQSQVIESRDALLKKVEETKARYPDPDQIPCPEFWGGYRLQPERIEFWMGQNDRLHDRFLYTRDGIHSLDWRCVRLAP